ncbi:MAG: 4-diphosphocytidyl-2C-methyl-D-erythritol synthase [Pedosphaera sp.]|nr:4-diphosphocytidyl-2C-methyl-D-erythritol synthase [Pedosphaera sp.]
MILAAGGSTRLGRPKQLLPFRGRSLLRHAAETALESVCRPVVVVLGAKAERLEAELNGLAVKVVNNPEWVSGMGSSIWAGLEAMGLAGDGEVDTNGVVIMLCDQPLISARRLDELVAAQSVCAKGIVAAEYGGTTGVPALFSRKYNGELAGLGAAEGAKRIILEHADDVERVYCPEGAIDIDTEADYERLQA